MDKSMLVYPYSYREVFECEMIITRRHIEMKSVALRGPCVATTLIGDLSIWVVQDKTCI